MTIGVLNFGGGIRTQNPCQIWFQALRGALPSCRPISPADLTSLYTIVKILKTIGDPAVRQVSEIQRLHCCCGVDVLIIFTPWFSIAPILLSPLASPCFHRTNRAITPHFLSTIAPILLFILASIAPIVLSHQSRYSSLFPLYRSCYHSNLAILP
jgi:hypothetical protein